MKKFSLVSFLSSQGVLIALAAADPVRLAALRQFSRAVQHLDGAALQFDVRAGGARHVLRHHDRRHRPFGRRDGGVRQRGRGAAEPLGHAGGHARRGRRGPRHRRAQRNRHCQAAHSAVHRDARDDAGGVRQRRCCWRRTSPSRSPTRAASPISARATSSTFPIPALIAARRPMSSDRSCSISPAPGARCWRSAATRTRAA